MASRYEYIIKDKAGNVLASMDSAKNRSFDKYLNKSGSASFDISIDDPKLYPDLLLLGDKELFIYRDGILEWGGELGTRRTQIDKETRKATIMAKGFSDLLSKKVVGSPISPTVYSNQDLGDIAWNEINNAQTGTNASLGITRGSHPTTRNADRNLNEFKTLKDVIEGMSNLNVINGFDFEIAANKQFTIFYPQRGSQKDDIVFEWGKNIVGLSENLDATNMANQVIALGAGQGPEMLVVTRNANSTIQGQYKIRQKLLSAKSATDTSTLNDNGDKELADRQTQQQIVSIVTSGESDPIYGTYGLGDKVRVRISNALFNIDALFRIYGIKVRITEEDQEEITLTFNP